MRSFPAGCLVVMLFLCLPHLEALDLVLQTTGSPSGGSEEMEDVVALPDGGVVMVGMTDGFSSGDGDGLVVRQDAGGTSSGPGLMGMPPTTCFSMLHPCPMASSFPDGR